MSSFWLNAVIDLLLVIYVLDCVFMGLLILMQRSKQDGAGTAFGGSGVQEIIGAGSGPLVKATVWAAALFFILSITLARLYAMRESSAVPISSVQQELEKTVAPATPSASAAPATPAPSGTATPLEPSNTATLTPAPAATSTTTPAKPAAPATK